MPFSRLCSARGAFRLLDLGLEQSFLDTVKRRSHLDQVAFFEQHLVQKTGDPRASTRLIASTRPTKSVVRVISLCAALTTPTGTAVGCCCWATAESARAKHRKAAKSACRILGSGVTLSNWAISIRSVVVTTAGFRQLQIFWQKDRAIFDKSAAYLMIPLQSSNESDEEVRLKQMISRTVPEMPNLRIRPASRRL